MKDTALIVKKDWTIIVLCASLIASVAAVIAGMGILANGVTTTIFDLLK